MGDKFRIILWVLLFAFVGALSRPFLKTIIDKATHPPLTNADRLHVVNELNARLPLMWADTIRWVSATYSEGNNTIQMNFEVLGRDGTVDPFATIGCDLPPYTDDPTEQVLARARAHFCPNDYKMNMFRREFAGVSLRFLDGRGGSSCMKSLSFADCGR